MRTSPTESATLFKVGVKRKGNDGNMYIITITKSGIKRWTKLKNDNDTFILSPIKNYLGNSSKKWNIRCRRNNSELEVLSLQINSKELIIEFKNKIFTKQTKVIKLSNLGVNITNSVSSMYIEIGYKDKNYNYFIEMNATKLKNNDVLLDLLGKYDKKKHFKSGMVDGMTQDYMDKTINHHYGDLCLMTRKRIKKCKVGEKYYIVEGQAWNSDYTGKYSIRVIEYTGEWIDDIYAPFKYVGKYKKDFMWINCSSKFHNFCSTGGGQDPVHFITKWNPKFKIPSAQTAKLFKC